MAEKEADNFGPNDHLHQVLGDEHPGRVRCRSGKRNVPSRYWSSDSATSSGSNSISQDQLRHAIEQVEKKFKEREDRMSQRILKAMSSAFSSLPPESAEACFATMRSIFEGGENDVGGDGHGEGSGHDDGRPHDGAVRGTVDSEGNHGTVDSEAAADETRDVDDCSDEEHHF